MNTIWGNIEGRRSLAALGLAILVLSAALRLAALDRQSLWDDEGFTLQDIGILGGTNPFGEAQPPLYFFLLSGWTALLGKGIAVVRSFSALWGIIAIALIGFAASRMISPSAGVLSAGILCLHPFHLAYSQEARCYTMAAALSICLIWAAWEKWIVACIAASAALFWTHPWGIFGWLAAIAILRSAWLFLAPVVAIPALLHIAGLGTRYKAFWAHPPGLKDFGLAWDALSGGAFYVGGWLFSLGWPQWICFGVFTALWIAGLRAEDTRRTRMVLVIGFAAFFLIPFAAAILVPEVTCHTRYFMMTLPIAVLIAVRGWATLPQRFKPLAPVLLMLAFSWGTFQYFTSWQKGTIKYAAAEAKALASPGALLIVPGYLRFLWDAYDQTGLPIADEASVDLDEVEVHPRMLFVTLDIPNELRDEMDSRFRLIARKVYPGNFHLGLTLSLYETYP